MMRPGQIFRYVSGGGARACRQRIARVCSSGVSPGTMMRRSRSATHLSASSPPSAEALDGLLLRYQLRDALLYQVQAQVRAPSRTLARDRSVARAVRHESRSVVDHARSDASWPDLGRQLRSAASVSALLHVRHPAVQQSVGNLRAKLLLRSPSTTTMAFAARREGEPKRGNALPAPLTTTTTTKIVVAPLRRRPVCRVLGTMLHRHLARQFEAVTQDRADMAAVEAELRRRLMDEFGEFNDDMVLWAFFDKANAGHIVYDQFDTALGELGMQLDAHDVQRLFFRYQDGNGKIVLRDFMRFVVGRDPLARTANLRRAAARRQLNLDEQRHLRQSWI